MMDLINHRLEEHQMNKAQAKLTEVPSAPPPQAERTETADPSCAEAFDEKEDVDCQGRPIAVSSKKKAKQKQKGRPKYTPSSPMNSWRVPSVQPSFMQTVTPYCCDCSRCWEVQQKPRVTTLSMAGGRSFAMVRNDLTSFFEKIFDFQEPSDRERKDQLGLCKVVLELCTVEIGCGILCRI